MCGGSGGGGSQTLGQWAPDIAPWWTSQLSYAEDLKNKPFQQYTGQRIADLHPAQLSGFDNINTLANQGGTVLSRASDDQAYRTLGDSYLTGDQKNPWTNVYSTTRENDYSGMANPYFAQVMGQGLDTMADKYQKGTAADTTRMFNLAGAFGGSAHQDAIKNNEEALASQMKQYISGMQNDQYNRSAGLDESFLGRDLQNQQYNQTKGLNAFENERNRQMGMVPMGGQQLNNALGLYNAQVGVGDSIRGYTQDILNQQYGDWQAAQNHPYQMEDWFTGLLSRAQGGMGPSYTQQGSSYQANPFSQILGAALAGKGLGFF